MVKIFRPYGEKREREYSHPGNEVEPHYIEKIDENGNPYLEQDGETDVYQEIQSYKESADVHAILDRYLNGDAAAMNRQGVFMDVSQMPQNFHEMFNMMAEQREAFYSLPLETREKFDHSFEKYATSAGTKAWAEKMGYKEEAKTGIAAIEKEVIKNES